MSVPLAESVGAAKGPEPEGRGYGHGGYGGGHVVSEKQKFATGSIFRRVAQP